MPNPRGSISATVEAAGTAGLQVLLTTGEGNNQSCQCVMIGIEHGSVLLECQKWIEPATDVLLTFDRISLKGRIRYCNSRQNRNRVSVAVAHEESDEERTAPRFPMDEPGSLIALGDHGTVVFPCRLTDFSRSGLGLRSPAEVAVGTMICIETGSIMVAGSVRRCLPAPSGGFQIGVSVTDVLSDNGRKRESLWSVAGIRLRVAEAILGRPIETTGHAICISRPRK